MNPISDEWDQDHAALSAWLNLPMTRRFQIKLLERFDPHEAVLSTTLGTSIDRLYGRAEVLEHIKNPKPILLPEN